jgi:hypothetical protein
VHPRAGGRPARRSNDGHRQPARPPPSCSRIASTGGFRPRWIEGDALGTAVYGLRSAPAGAGVLPAVAPPMIHFARSPMRAAGAAPGLHRLGNRLRAADRGSLRALPPPWFGYARSSSAASAGASPRWHASRCCGLSTSSPRWRWSPSSPRRAPRPASCSGTHRRHRRGGYRLALAVPPCRPLAQLLPLVWLGLAAGRLAGLTWLAASSSPLVDHRLLRRNETHAALATCAGGLLRCSSLAALASVSRWKACSAPVT